MKLKKGDQVMVLSGNDRGKVGVIEQILPRQSRAVVAGINVHTKHVKRTSNRKRGGLERAPRPMHISSLGLLQPGSKTKPTRVGYGIKKTGQKVRVARQASNKEIKS